MSTITNGATQAGSQQADHEKEVPVDDGEEELDDDRYSDPSIVFNIPDLQTPVGDGTDRYIPENQPMEKPDDWDPDCVIPSGKAREAWLERIAEEAEL